MTRKMTAEEKCHLEQDIWGLVGESWLAIFDKVVSMFKRKKKKKKQSHHNKRGRDPYPFQVEGVDMMERFMKKRKGKLRVLLADSMGLGKTLQSIMFLKRHPEIRPAIVICPATAKYSWEREFQLEGMTAEVLGTTKALSSVPKRLPDAYIINYDILGPWLSFLEMVNPEMLIIDECHMIGNPSARRTRHVRELGKKVDNILALSGTPLVNRPGELWPTLNMLLPKKFPSMFSFGSLFCQASFNYGGWKFKGADNLKLLNRKLKRTCMIRRRKEEVIEDLPDHVTTVVPFRLKPKQMREYLEAKQDFKGWLIRNYPERAGSSARVQALAKVGYLLRMIAEFKREWIIQWIDEFFEQSDSKLIVFGIHRDKMLKPLAEHYRERCVLVDGDVTGRGRQEAIDRFNEDESCDIFFGNIKAAGAAWSAKKCSDVAFTELAWAPGWHNQASDRVRGIGRGVEGKKANSWYLIARDTLEEPLCQLLEEKQESASTILDGGKMPEDFSVFNRLMKLLREEP